MKYKLSFCEIEQLADNIFEVTINDGAIIDEECALEAEKFWHELRKEPYCLLVNNKNCFSYSFVGAQKIGEHSLERKTAVLIDHHVTEEQMSTVKELKEMTGGWANRQVFTNREKALCWLRNG